ncbi:MAG: DUF481 domain-containing protein [Gammaproteobacteria bacterium]|nr:DUF481 domain-containing protein [Gammaproteobacteria bacterium]MCW8840678.1 DUF481 domain-containing protein [Gammaproteobacteria bacterium]MCW8957845.1 DUF481 domain-containing protein [Gammaproteobacteria bacterium]MCW8993740.1 DUF481 domain-containing protein [Gammaproteobacteria bacterium]
MKPIAGALILALATTASGTAVAQDWSGEGEFGFVSTDSETTSSDTLTLKARIARETERWRHTAKAEALYAESENEEGISSRTSERLFASWKTDRKLGEKHYIYGLINYETDGVLDLDYRVNESVGYGIRLLRGPRHVLDTEIGVGARQTSINDVREDEGVLRLAADYRYNINDAAHISEEASVEHGSDSTVTRSITGLSAKIQGNLASKISYTYQHVDTDGDTTDESIFAVTLVYSF